MVVEALELFNGSFAGAGLSNMSDVMSNVTECIDYIFQFTYQTLQIEC